MRSKPVAYAKESGPLLYKEPVRRFSKRSIVKVGGLNTQVLLASV